MKHIDTNNISIKIQQADSKYQQTIVNLLSANHLPTIDLSESPVELFVATLNNELIGTIGIERYNSIGLLRSLAVTNTYKNNKVGEKLLVYLLDFCKGESITDLYLLTTTADNYFAKFGFQIVERKNVPSEIAQTNEFKDICPLSAVVMKINL